ncbi:hypothetical protein H0H87_006774 [Tephrocybe sp. NHM501043]|nr:hypothetical protein H0H87_006774 [Tephrocybe sp. NHM501043]
MNELLVDDLFKQHCSAAAKTNDIISTNEERQRGIDLLKCLVLKRSALSDLERGLLVSAQMDLAVDKISNERASRRRNTNDLQIAQLRISFAPHKRLPSKILATIFVAAVEGDDLISFPILLSQIPWVLGRVCNRWREISRAEPNLWNGVRMKIVGKRLPEAVSFLYNTLPASGPLTMMLEIARDCETSTVETLILPYSRRLEKFHLSGPDAMWQGLDIPAQSFSAVEDWAMAVHPLYRTSEVLKKLVFFRYTNNLRSFNAGGPIIKPEGQLINYNLPFHQLAHLDLSHVSEGYRLTDMLGLLRESSSLQSFSSPLADPSAMPHTGSTASSELILPNLKTMDINNAVAMNLPLQWNNLTDLTIYVSFRAHGVLDRVLDILDSLQLNSLSFGHHPGRFVVASPLRIITITNLRKLSIQASGSRILGHLRLPQLVEIDVDGGRQNQHSFISNLSDLVTRSGCALEILSYDSPSNGRKRFHDDEFWASNVSATPARNLPAPPPPPPGVDPTSKILSIVWSRS